MTDSMSRRERFAHLIPSTLGSRLAVSILLANLVVITITVLVLVLMSNFSISTVQQIAFLSIVLTVAGLTGLVAGVTLARTIGRPLTEFSAYMSSEANAALDGREPGPLPRDPMLPIEHVRLLDVFEQLLHRLTVRNAELIEATERAESANHSLTIAFSDSLEGKLLVRNDVVALMNPAAGALFAISPTQAEGRPPQEVFAHSSARDDEGRRLTFAQIVELSRSSAIRVRYEVRNRTARWIEVRSVVHAEAATTLLTMRDVTDELRVAQLRDEILSLVSHDLKSPLTVISGYLDLLERDLPPDTRAKALSSARQASERMDELLNDLLSATRAEKLLSPTEFAPVSLSLLAEETVSSFEHITTHVISVDAKGTGTVLGDERRLRQVLVNLLTNAMKYSDEGTEISVTVRQLYGRVLLTVDDSGPGIPVEHRDAVFERFERLKDENGTEHPGFGLGLYIVRAIVESHGGSVQIEETDSGTGARFVVALPAAAV